ncbi:putative oxidoreductase [Kingella potus]|uniref:Putative oxidoreductase n=1 Tax=Kingella potus TaxID=265175 RepID=A0A377R2I3_9NEIS|nr:aldo/keto reductase [Kingella potus]UOP00464.1 aldo/keto reductase [Kingella potus]STR02469.1 putative oxidoreductase [Kingella potus]
MSQKNTVNKIRRSLLAGAGMMAGAAAVAAAGLVPNAQAATQRGRFSPAQPAANGTQRRIGQFVVNPIAMGAMNTAWGYGDAMSVKDAARLFRQAHDDGQTFFDTAEAYGAWLSEEMLGEAFATMRDKVIIASKFGFKINEKGDIAGLDSRPENIRRALEGSLKRLKTDYVDILYQHRVDPTVPIEDAAGTVQDLIREGKVRSFGLSEAGDATIRRAHAVQPVVALQNEYSFWTRDPEQEVLQTCAELGIALIPWAPLGKGFLTGTVTKDTRFTALPKARLTAGRACRVSRPKPSPPTGAWWKSCKTLPAATTPASPKPPWHGCLPERRLSCRFPEHATPPANAKIWRRRKYSSAAKT